MRQDQNGGDARPSLDAPPPYAPMPAAPTTSPALLAMAIATVLLVVGGSGIALWRHAGITNASPAAVVLESPTPVPTAAPAPTATARPGASPWVARTSRRGE